MGPKCFYSQIFSLFKVKFKKFGFSAPLTRFNCSASVEQGKMVIDTMLIMKYYT